MKSTHYFLIASVFLIQSIFSLQAQNTEGREFWLTFGFNPGQNQNQPVDLYIRIANGGNATSGKIEFTELGTFIPFNILPNQIFTYKINYQSTQFYAVYNTTMGKTNKSVRITSDQNVSVYIMNQCYAATDATNIFPITTLATEYRQISYTPSIGLDAYVVVATENNTTVEHNGTFLATLNKGEVYYRTQNSDMTGVRISSSKPVAFFTVPQGNNIPGPPFSHCCGDILFQQLAPVNTWGKTFFVPVSHFTIDRVRIVASENGTTITQIGGALVSSQGSQMSLNNLQAGQFVELEILLNSANTGCQYQGFNISDPAQSWLPALEQKVPASLIAPFKPDGSTLITIHHALIVTQTATKNDTKFSVGGGPLMSLIGGSWKDHLVSGMSFYNLPLTNSNDSYYFTNNNGLVILCYGAGNAESYYYLAGSAMRDLDAAFYANDIHFQELKENPFCAGLVEFRAEINGLHPTHSERLTWWIDGVEYLPAKNLEQWSKTFSVGEYEIKMIVRYENDETATKIGTLKIIPCNYSAEFFANDIPHSLLQNNTICNKTGKVDFRAVVEGIHPGAGSLKWYVDGVKEDAADDQLTWSKTFATGVYEIKMWVRYDNGETAEIISTLKVEIFWIKMQNVRH